MQTDVGISVGGIIPSLRLFLRHFEVGFCHSLASFSLPALQPASLPSTHRVPIPLPDNLGSVEGGQACSALPQLPRFATVQWALERAGPRKGPAALPLCTWQWPVSATHCQRVDLALLHREKARPMSLCVGAHHPHVQLCPHSVPWPWEESSDRRGLWHPAGWFTPLAGTLMKTELPY